MKKPWYKRWKVWGYMWAALIVIGILVPENVEPEVVAEVEKQKTVEVAADKTPGEIALEADEERRLAEAKKAEAKVKVEADAKAKVAADAKKAKAAEKAANVTEALATEIALIKELTQGIVIAVEKSPYGQDDWMITWVTVSDDWYDSEIHVKERFADQIGAQVKSSLYAAGAVKKGDPILVHFYDTHAKELAKEKIFGGYDIKR